MTLVEFKQGKKKKFNDFSQGTTNPVSGAALGTYQFRQKLFACPLLWRWLMIFYLPIKKYYSPQASNILQGWTNTITRSPASPPSAQPGIEMNFQRLQWNCTTTFQKKAFVATSKHLMAWVRHSCFRYLLCQRREKKWAYSTGMNRGDTSRSCFSSATGPQRQTSLVLGSLRCSFVQHRHCKVTGNTH